MDSITKIFKALFSGIGNFFKILVEGITGVFSGSTVDVLSKDSGSADAPAPTSEPTFRSGAVPVATASTSIAKPSTTPAVTEATSSTDSTNEVVAAVADDGPIEIVEIPQPEGDVQFASLTEVKALERPKRRPGAALSPFKAMVRDMQASKG
ncbi:MAG: hypothetical protein AAF974_13250 [Cyanobacteria bacterium P01_E01_bin.34]